jgi:hypothetical protein
MDQDWRLNKAIPVKLLLLLLEAADLKFEKQFLPKRRIDGLSSTPMWLCATQFLSMAAEDSCLI